MSMVFCAENENNDNKQYEWQKFVIPTLRKSIKIGWVQV